MCVLYNTGCCDSLNPLQRLGFSPINKPQLYPSIKSDSPTRLTEGYLILEACFRASLGFRTSVLHIRSDGAQLMSTIGIGVHLVGGQRSTAVGWQTRPVAVDNSNRAVGDERNRCAVHDFVEQINVLLGETEAIVLRHFEPFNLNT